LPNRALQTTRHARPSAAAVRAELPPEVLSCESEQLTQDLLAFVVDRTQGLKDHRAKEKVSAFETLVVLPVLLDQSVVLAWAHEPLTTLRERACHCDIDG